jgi:hypothetical protein
MNYDYSRIVGKAAIADRAGVAQVTVYGWSKRHDWPEVRGYLSTTTSGPGSQPFWDWDDDIVPFLERNPGLAQANRRGRL